MRLQYVCKYVSLISIPEPVNARIRFSLHEEKIKIPEAIGIKGIKGTLCTFFTYHKPILKMLLLFISV